MNTKIHEIAFEANKVYQRTGKTPAQLEETNRELLEALKPFAELANECLFNNNLHRDQILYAYNKAKISMQDLRNVLSAIQKATE